MVKELILDFTFTIRTMIYMCNVIENSNNFKSLRRR